MDEQLTSEEIFLICGEKLTKEYDLTNMYSVCDNYGQEKCCPDCRLEHRPENDHLFYTCKYTRCIQCSKKNMTEYQKNNKQKVRLYHQRYRQRRKQTDQLFNEYNL